MNRRNLLKSAAGACVASGFLGNELRASNSAPISSKKNLVIIVTMLGFNHKTFYPAAGTMESSLLARNLKDHYEDITLFKDIMQPEIVRGHNGGRGILTCNRNQTNGPYISLDQLVSDKLVQQSRHKSVHMGNKTISWSKSSRSVKTMFEFEPDKIFDHLFGETPLDEIEAKLNSLKNFRKKLPGSKNNKKAYIAALEENEKALNTELKWAAKPVPKVEFDGKLHFSDHHGRGMMTPFEQYLELIRLSIKHQRGQVFVVSPPYIDKTAFGLSGSYHNIGHHAHNNKQKFDDMLKLENELFKNVSDFMSNLKKDNKFDDTIILNIGAFSSPGGHSREYLPTILAGGGFKHQGLIQCKEKEIIHRPMSHLYVSVMHQMGIPIDEFSGHRGNLDKLIG